MATTTYSKIGPKRSEVDCDTGYASSFQIIYRNGAPFGLIERIYIGHNGKLEEIQVHTGSYYGNEAHDVWAPTARAMTAEAKAYAATVNEAPEHDMLAKIAEVEKALGVMGYRRGRRI